MGVMGVVYRAVDGLRDSGAVQRARRAWFDQRFRHDRAAHLFRGVFDSFEAALASAPPTVPKGYDNPASADLYLKRLQIDDYDYPSLFWLTRSFADGLHRVADVGGAVGIKYFAFQALVDYPSDLLWRVIDVPAVARRGREFAASQSAGPALEFSDRIGDAEGCDIFFASGSLQYLDQSLPEILATQSARPARIIVNTTPIHPNQAFFTLNSIGTAYCAYRVEARDPFVAGVEAQGYRLRDHWRNVGKKMHVAFEPDCNVDHYSGFCFDRIG